MAAPFAEIFEGYALDNIMFVVNRDMLTRLDEQNGAGVLPDFAEKTLGRITGLSYPSFALDHLRGSGTEGEHYIENEVRLEALIRVVDADPVVVTRNAVKYVRAFKTVIRGASHADWVRNISSPEIMPLFITIAYEYGAIGKNPNKPSEWMRDVDFELSFRFNER